MRRPVMSLILAAGVLVVAALPFLSTKTGFGGVGTLPDEVASKQAFLIMEPELSGGLGSPVEIVVGAPASPPIQPPAGAHSRSRENHEPVT